MRAKRMKNMERTEGAEPSFNEIIDVSDDMRRRRGRRRKTVAMRVSAALLIVISICIGGFPAMLQYRSAHELSNTSDRSARAVAGWPYPQADDAIAAAKEYNKRLAASGQPLLGEAKDPFSQAQGSTKVPVDYTPVKFVKKPAGAKPGMVIYTTYQTMLADPDESLVKRLAGK